MSKVTDAAANVSHPLAAADASGLTNIHRVALAATSTAIALPTNPTWQGRFVTLFNDSANDIQYAFGAGAAPTIVMDQAAAVGTGHVSCGKTIKAGESVCGRVRVGATHLAFISSAASGFIEIEVSQSAN